MHYWCDSSAGLGREAVNDALLGAVSALLCMAPFRLQALPVCRRHPDFSVAIHGVGGPFHMLQVPERKLTSNLGSLYLQLSHMCAQAFVTSHRPRDGRIVASLRSALL